MQYHELDDLDLELIQSAVDIIKKNFYDEKITVGAAVRCANGKIYCGVNLDSCGYGPCAEPVALGAAICHGERKFLTIVAVSGWRVGNAILPPCGNCRQLLLDYAPDVFVILDKNGKKVKVKAHELLPDPFFNFG